MNNKYKILVVEDEANIRSFVGALLEANGYQVVLTGTCQSALTLFSSFLPDLTILDLGLPDMDGMVFLQKIRERFASAVIVLSARTQEQDKVLALDMGANDYITKPFGSAEFLARVRSVLRTSCHSAAEGKLPGGQFAVNGLRIVYDSRRVFVDDREIKLTQTEFNILALLSEQNGKVMTYAAIIKAIWGYPDEGSIKKLQVNMANIRKKLGVRPGENRFFTNELGVGYRMVDAGE